jgi:nucleoside-diphosphate-sugar epimerase
MRIAVTGATGNLGTSLLEALDKSSVDEIVGVARRLPERSFARTRFVARDTGAHDLEPVFRGMDAVVHLAWRIQPSHDAPSLEETNVEGARRVFDAVVRAEVPALIVVSSVGAYSRGPEDKNQRVDEHWPTNGVPTSLYSRQKARVERLMDRLERDRPSLRLVRIRPALVFKAEAASDIRRLFIGPLLPRIAFDRSMLRVVPDHPRLRVQCVHSRDVGTALRAAIERDVRGPFHLAAEPVLDPALLSERLGATRVPVSESVMRSVIGATWRLRLQPIAEGWVDLGLGVPLMDTTRARTELDWQPRYAADDSLLELVDGLRAGTGDATPPLAPRRGLGLFRAIEQGRNDT